MGTRSGVRRAKPAAIVLLLGLALAGAWVPWPGPASAQIDGDPEQGRELFATHCAACHGPDALGAGTAPNLTGVTGRLGEDQVAATIREGRGGMPAFGGRLAEAEIGHLVAHLEQRSADSGAEVDDRGRSGMPMMHGRWRDMMGDWPLRVGLLWLAMVLAVVVLVVAGVVWIARSASSPPPRQHPSGSAAASAREILDQRYARGELSQEDYLEMRRDLEEPG